MRPFKRIKRFFRYMLLRSFYACASILPLAFARKLGTLLGGLLFFILAKERQKALQSLALAFPELPGETREDMAHRCFQHLGLSAMELACIRSLDDRIEEYVKWPFEARQVFEEALARKKGVLFVSGHVGNWELLARRVALAGYPCQTIAKETTDARLTRWVEKFRAQAGLKSIWRGQPSAARHMLKALKQGEVLGMLIDQDTQVQSVFVPFFGHLASTPRAAAELALRTGAAIVLGFCQREENGTYVVSMEEIVQPHANDEEATVRQWTALMTEGIEKAIRRHPEQWVWMHRRWKTQPPSL